MRLLDDPKRNSSADNARCETPMEWWFVQGAFCGEQIGKREFMAALFRYRHIACDAPAPGIDAFCLLLSVLDPSTGQSRLLSQVDPATCEFLMKAYQRMPAGLDPLVMNALSDEMREYGPARPIRCEPSPVELTAAPFRFVWNNMMLERDADVFTLMFSEPQTGCRCDFRLTPIHPPIHISDIAVADRESMEYVSYTRLELNGKVDEEQVYGQAWIDHQWGSRGWFASGCDDSKVLGWDWLGIQLDDGRDLLVMTHRDVSSGKSLCQYAVLVTAAGTPRLIRDFEWTQTAWWTSPATRARYPVSCHITVPELDLDLQFTPDIPAQEIPMLAPVRAVWEGAGHVSGTWDRQKVQGRARLELHGYAYILDLHDHFDSMVKLVGQHVETYLPRSISVEAIEQYAGPAQGQYDAVAQTSVLAEPLWDLLDRGGKRWRSIFVFLMLDALGVSREPYELLCSLMAELPHGGSLVIDDIEDNARLRRGQECIHLRYGLDVAINAGNTAYFLPMTLLRDYPHLNDSQRLELYRILSQVYVRAHLGQGQDIYWSRALTPERLQDWLNDSLGPKLVQLYNQKTGSAVEGLAECACVIAGTDEDTRYACAEFGRTVGVAFQIVDDIIDFSAERIRQGIGGRDLSEGKLTYVVFHSLASLPSEERARLGEILCSPRMRRDPSALAEGIRLIRNSGAPSFCLQQARAMVENQWQRLSAHLPPSEPKLILRSLCRFILGLGDDELHC
jgi:geranylgeranyl pyrophosphate synthase